MRSTLAVRCLAQILMVAVLAGTPALVHAAWQPFNTYHISGPDPVPISATTANGVTVRFIFSSDCVPCGFSSECQEGTSALVEYDETVVSGATTALDVRFSYVPPCSPIPCSDQNASMHWWGVDATGMVPCFSPPTVLCGPIWGYQGNYPCEGTCEFHFERFVTGSSPVLNETRTTLSWTSVSGAASYDIVRGDLDMLRSTAGDFTRSTLDCLANDRGSTSLPYSAVPTSGKTWWILVRGIVCGGGGTYNGGSPRQVGSRDPEIAASGDGCP